MKKFLLLALAAFALAACNDDDTPDEFVQGDNTIAVFENDRLVFYDYDVFWEYSEPYTDPYGVTCIDLYMNKTRFVQNMPALDMNPHSPDSRRIRIRLATGGPLLSRRTDAALHALRPRRRTERHASRSGVLLHRLRRRISGTVLNARRSPPKSAATLRAGKENRSAAHFFVRCQTKRRRTNHFVKPSAIEFTRIAEARNGA